MNFTCDVTDLLHASFTMRKQHELLILKQAAKSLERALLILLMNSVLMPANMLMALPYFSVIRR